MNLTLVNLTGSTKTYLSGAVSVPGNGSTSVTDTTQQLSLATDGSLRSDIFASIIQISDGTTQYGAHNSIDYLDKIPEILGATSDGTGKNITSTTISAKQCLDVNVVGSNSFNDTAGTGTITANGQAVVAATTGCSSATFKITGTWVGTVQIQISIDGTTYDTREAKDITLNDGALIEQFTQNLAFVLSCGGFKFVRIVATAWTSGTLNAAWVASVGSNTASVYSESYASLLATVKLGDGSNGTSVTANGDLGVSDGLSGGGVYGNLALTTANTAYEVRVGASRLANRKMVTIQATDSDMYWGYDSSVATTTGTLLQKGTLIAFSADPSAASVLQIWLVCASSSKNARITESA